MDPAVFFTRGDTGENPLGGRRQEAMYMPVRFPRFTGREKQWVRVGSDNKDSPLCVFKYFEQNPNLENRGVTQVMCVPGKRLVYDTTRTINCHTDKDQCSGTVQLADNDNGGPSRAEQREEEYVKHNKKIADEWKKSQIELIKQQKQDDATRDYNAEYNTRKAAAQAKAKADYLAKLWTETVKSEK